MKDNLKILIKVLESKEQMGLGEISKVGEELTGGWQNNNKLFGSMWAPWSFSDRLRRNMEVLEKQGLVKIEKIDNKYKYSLVK